MDVKFKSTNSVWSLVLSLAFIMGQVNISMQAGMSTEELLSKYKPIAMDESWKLISSETKPKDSLSQMRIAGSLDELNGPSLSPIDYPLMTNEKPRKKFTENTLPPEIESRLANFDDINESSLPGVIDEDQWLRIPPKGSKFADRLDPKKSTTFVYPEVVQPVVGSPPDKSNVLAQYQIVVPLFIPAIKKKILKPTPKSVKYIKETITEMVPIKQSIPRVKEIIKAEPVSHRVRTDFIRTDEKELPRLSGDEIRTGERVVASTVTNFV